MSIQKSHQCGLSAAWGRAYVNCLVTGEGVHQYKTPGQVCLLVIFHTVAGRGLRWAKETRVVIQGLGSNLIHSRTNSLADEIDTGREYY